MFSDHDLVCAENVTFDHSRIQSRQNGCPQTSGKPIAWPLNLSRQIGQATEFPVEESESELCTSSSFPLSTSVSTIEESLNTNI